MEIEKDLRDWSESKAKHVLPLPLPLTEPAPEAHRRTTIHVASCHNCLCRTRSERERPSERERAGFWVEPGSVATTCASRHHQRLCQTRLERERGRARERERDSWRESVWVIGLGGWKGQRERPRDRAQQVLWFGWELIWVGNMKGWHLYLRPCSLFVD